jgi:hypothetical protein
VGVYTDGNKLFVADILNQRVLIFNSIPTSNGASADVVVGQPNFTSNSSGTTANTLNFFTADWGRGSYDLRFKIDRG